jgi:hypothetical protein
MKALAEELERESGGARVEALEGKLAEVQADVAEVRACVEGTAEEARVKADELAGRLFEIESALSSAGPATIARAARALPGAGASPLLKKIQPYYPAGKDNGGIVVCVASAPGGGKTTAISQLGMEYDTFISHGCSNDMDEVTNLLGGATPDGRGGFIVTDGPLVQAFRAAAAGQTVLLFLDEIFRLQESAQKYLLTVLEPNKSTGNFRVRTRRADASGAFEILECSPEKLHIIAAGNLSTLEPEEAFWRRFEHIRIGWEISECMEIAIAIGKRYGIEISIKAANAWASAVFVTRTECKAGALRYPLTNATLARACAVATGATNAELLESVGASISGGLPSNCCVWDSELGESTSHSAAAAASIVEHFLRGWSEATKEAAAV